MPVAFIETAWRRYTKHSRNKAQEIQGAIEPLAATYKHTGPFKGAVLAGEFTTGALTQMKSLGFSIVYFPYDLVVQAFREFGVDASSNERTTDAQFDRKIRKLKGLSQAKRKKLSERLVALNFKNVDVFMASLSKTMKRQIDCIIILALHGQSHEVTTVEAAIQFIQKYAGKREVKPIDRYEIQIRYNNGNEVLGSFKDKESAIEFLRTYQPVTPATGV
jgi:hypothetical protein